MNKYREVKYHMLDFYTQIARDHCPCPGTEVIDIDENAAARTGNWQLDSGYNYFDGRWWLNESGNVYAKGEMVLEPAGEGYINIKYVYASWLWVDNIDAKTFGDKNLPLNAVGIIEGLVDIVGDRVLGAAFGVNVKWRNEDHKIRVKCK